MSAYCGHSRKTPPVLLAVINSHRAPIAGTAERNALPMCPPFVESATRLCRSLDACGLLILAAAFPSISKCASLCSSSPQSPQQHGLQGTFAARRGLLSSCAKPLSISPQHDPYSPSPPWTPSLLLSSCPSHQETIGWSSVSPDFSSSSLTSLLSFHHLHPLHIPAPVPFSQPRLPSPLPPLLPAPIPHPSPQTKRNRPAKGACLLPGGLVVHLAWGRETGGNPEGEISSKAIQLPDPHRRSGEAYP